MTLTSQPAYQPPTFQQQSEPTQTNGAATPTSQQAQLLRDLTNAVGAEKPSAQLNNLVQDSDPKALAHLSNVTPNLSNDSIKELGALLEDLDDDPERQSALLNLAGDLNINEFEALVGVLGDLDDDPEHQSALLDLAGDLSTDELRDLVEELDRDNLEVLDLDDFDDVLDILFDLILFFDPDDLDDGRVSFLFDLLRFFDLDDLDDDERRDLLSLLRFFDLDDLDDLRFEIDDIESGDVEPSIDIRNFGDNVNLCLGIAQAANSGNVVNQQGVTQFQSEADDDGFVFGDDRFGFIDDFDFDDFDFDDRDGDIEFEGSSIEIDSEVDVDCQQAIIQTAAAGRAPSLVRGGAVASAAAPVSAAPISAGFAAPRAATTAAVTTASSVGGGPAALGLVARPAQLPRTGGLPLTLTVLGLAGIGAGLTLWRYRQR